jgi:ERCC4-type nuclease
MPCLLLPAWLNKANEGGTMNRPTIIVDNREQLPYPFNGYECEVKQGTLYTSDYSIEGLEEYIAIEVKHSLSDLICCMTSDRERFKHNLLRMQGVKVKAVIIEANLSDIIKHNYRSKIHPNSVIGSISSWTIRYGVPFIFAGDRQGGELMCYSILSNYYRQCQEFIKKLTSKIGA